MRILFQGDSVTDAGRNYADPDDLGPGYPKYAAERLRELFPDREFVFYNRGISGNRSSQLLARWQRDALDLKPDLVTLLIGVNDGWHRYDPVHICTSRTVYRENLKTILSSVKATGAKIILLEPFCHKTPAIPDFRNDLNGMIEVCRDLAREYADAYLPLDGMLAADAVIHPYDHLTNDGVHPNEEGRKWLGTLLADEIAKLIR